MPKGWKVPENKRELFKEPLGKLTTLEELKHTQNIISVGDVVSLTVWENGIRPLVTIYDGKTERREMSDFAKFVEKHNLVKRNVINPPGCITKELVDVILNALNEKTTTICVDGEEDLALMPCILYAPENTTLLYGWPGKGMMSLVVDENIKNKIKKLWKEMEEFE